MERAIFAGGCFWCMVQPFEEQEGILSVRSGYTGGHVPNPTYEEDVYKRQVIDGFIGFYLYSVGYGKLGVAYSFSSGSVCFVTYSLHQ